MNKRNDFAKAFGITGGILWIICTVGTFFFPGMFLTLVQWVCHGLDIALLGEPNITFISFLGGGAVVTIASVIVGYILGWSMDIVQKRT